MTVLGHVNIRTHRFAETIQFYEDVLGFTAGPAATRPQSDKHAWLRDPTGRSSIHVQEEAATAQPGATASPCYHHISFDCIDPDNWRLRLGSTGAPFSETVFAEAGLLQFNLADPNGLLIELTFKAPF